MVVGSVSQIRARLHQGVVAQAARTTFLIWFRKCISFKSTKRVFRCVSKVSIVT
ncbi:hypothetical protein HanRHA438_Chr05g0239791 [Helianthus annuus]|nr:hypothetical protein HanRHA438_Chr05g0239791 [Helianthus annuus]